jgi:hypothetical protein
MDVASVIHDLESSGFRDLAGARASARIPLSRLLVNRLVADALGGTSAPIRRLEVHPHAGDRFTLSITLTWPFVPTLTATVTVDQQPRFPDSPFLVCRWALLGALGTIGARVVSSMRDLPPGFRLDGNRLVIDVPTAARVFDRAAAIVPFLTALELHSEEDAVVIEAALAVSHAPGRAV